MIGSMWLPQRPVCRRCSQSSSNLEERWLYLSDQASRISCLVTRKNGYVIEEKLPVAFVPLIGKDGFKEYY